MAIVDSFGRLLASCDRAEVGGNKEKRTTAVAKKDLSEDRAVMMKYLWRLVSDVQSGICHIVFGWCGRPSSITCQRPIDLFLSNYRPLSSIQPSPLSQSKWLFRSSPSPPSPFDPSYFCSSSLHRPPPAFSKTARKWSCGIRFMTGFLRFNVRLQEIVDKDVRRWDESSYDSLDYWRNIFIVVRMNGLPRQIISWMTEYNIGLLAKRNRLNVYSIMCYCRPTNRSCTPYSTIQTMFVCICNFRCLRSGNSAIQPASTSSRVLTPV